MKKAILFFALFQAWIGFTQIISSIEIYPDNPSSVDDVYLITTVEMPNSGIYLGSQVSISGTAITVSGCYYEGLATILEIIIDTIYLGVLSTNAYSINFVAHQSYSSSSCIPVDSTNVETNFVVIPPLSVQASTNNFSLEVYPNPTNSNVIIEFELPNKSSIEIDLIDLNGKLVKSLSRGEKAFGQQKFTFDLTEISNGIYFIRLRINDEYYFEKVVNE